MERCREGWRLAWVRCAAAQVGFLALGGAVRRLRRGMAASRAQVDPYAEAWRAANQADAAAAGRLWIVLGDSAAQGVGADTHAGGYVGQLRALLEERDAQAWRVLNLSRSGARVADLLDEQLPLLGGMTGTADLVTCAIGANDLLRTPRRRLIALVRKLLHALPDEAVIATMPQGLGRRKAGAVNAVIRAEAPARGLRVVDVWAHTGPPWRGKYASDWFHPNERGYADWTRAFADALDLPAKVG